MSGTLLISGFNLLEPQKSLVLRSMTNHVTCGRWVSSHIFCKYLERGLRNRKRTYLVKSVLTSN